jgi:hypothetical protein
MDRIDAEAAMSTLLDLDAKPLTRQGSVQDDARQPGGVPIVRPGGVVGCRYVSAAAGDHAPVAEILRALGAPAREGGHARKE